RKLERPYWSFTTPSVRWQFGRRRSTSSRMTREPASARLVARFTEVTVLPSLAPALVSRMTLGGAPGAEKSTAVRRLRNASAAGDVGSLSMTRSGLLPPPLPFATGATALLDRKSVV